MINFLMFELYFNFKMWRRREAGRREEEEKKRGEEGRSKVANVKHIVTR